MNVQSVLHTIDGISTWVGKAAAWLIIILMTVVCVEVFKRYILNSPDAWIFDIDNMLYGTLFMLAGAYALAQNAHVRGDIFGVESGAAEADHPGEHLLRVGAVQGVDGGGIAACRGADEVGTRTLGPDLELLDGRRVVATNRFGNVDVNILPSMLLKNVETVTGGASASYGTDAVAGAHGRNAEDLVCRVQSAGEPPMHALVSATSVTAQSMAAFRRSSLNSKWSCPPRLWTCAPTQNVSLCFATSAALRSFRTVVSVSWQVAPTL